MTSSGFDTLGLPDAVWGLAGAVAVVAVKSSSLDAE